MSTATPGPGLLTRSYRVVVDDAGRVDVELFDEPRPELSVVDGELIGPHVRVRTRAVLVEVGPDGELRGRATDPLVLRDGALCFDPSKGGERARENRRARGAFNALVAEANRFGMVNAYVHADRAAVYVNRLLAEAGGQPLPPLVVVVGAHYGSRLPGFAEGDGDVRSGGVRPMSGGHYRVSIRTEEVCELEPIVPTGEIHLGCRRYRKPYAGVASYLRNAAHNPAIVYHEYGHHLCRHTADFRLNAEREPDEQRNGKIGIEEGVSDYLAAVLLGSGRPYGWYAPERGRLRDLEVARHVAEIETDHDVYAKGAVWAAAWWRARGELVADGLLADPEDHDRALVAALLRVGRVGRPDGRSRRRRERRRSSASTMTKAYLEAVRDAGGERATDVAAAILECAGLIGAPTPPAAEAALEEVTGSC